MKPVRFTGGDGLTGFELKVHQVLFQNEVDPTEPIQAYQLSRAQGERSGYSFGPVQWDLSSDHDIDKTPGNGLTARQLFRDILTNALGQQEANRIAAFVETHTSGLPQSDVDKVNAALQTPYGVQQINAAYPRELNTAIGWRKRGQATFLKPLLADRVAAAWRRAPAWRRCAVATLPCRRELDG